MQVFIESNFILELAFQQQEYIACEKLFAAAETGQIDLVVPVYCLTEVFQTLGSRRQKRQEAEQFIQQEIKQHLREQGVVTMEVEALGASLRQLLLARTETQTASLFGVVTRLTEIARVLPLPAVTLLAAQQAQLRHSLSTQDALVFASVYIDLVAQENGPYVFVSRNEEDFGKAELLAELRQRNCEYLSHFNAVVGRLRL